MSYAARLIHPLNIVRIAWDEDSVDDHGSPIPQAPTLTPVNGLVQPRSQGRGGEVPQPSQAGAVVSDHVVFLPIVDLIEADALEHDPADGRRYEILGIREYAFGRSPHLEVDARMVRGRVREAVGS